MSVSLKIIFYNVYFKDVKSFCFKLSTELNGLSIFSQIARDLQINTSPIYTPLCACSLVLSDLERGLSDVVVGITLRLSQKYSEVRIFDPH